MNKDDAFKENIDQLIKLSKYIDYTGRFKKDEIKKSKKLLEKLKTEIEKGNITLFDN